MTAIWGSVSAAREAPTRAVINIATSGDNTIIAAPAAGFIIKIVKMFFAVASSVNVTFKSGANALTGAMTFATGLGSTNVFSFDGDFNPLSMNAAEAFIINLSGNVQVSGFVLYYVEKGQSVENEAAP